MSYDPSGIQEELEATLKLRTPEDIIAFLGLRIFSHKINACDWLGLFCWMTAEMEEL